MFCEFASCHKDSRKSENCVKIVLRSSVNLGPEFYHLDNRTLSANRGYGANCRLLQRTRFLLAACLLAKNKV